MKAKFQDLKEKLAYAGKWGLGILIASILITACSLLIRSWWIAMGETIQQIILGVIGVGVLYYCVLPIIGFLIIIGIVIALNWDEIF